MNDSSKVVAVRLTDDLLKQVAEFAEQVGYVDQYGTLNISAALRVLILLGLGETIVSIDKTTYQSAKGAALHEIALKIQETLKGYRDND